MCRTIWDVSPQSRFPALSPQGGKAVAQPAKAGANANRDIIQARRVGKARKSPPDSYEFIAEQCWGDTIATPTLPACGLLKSVYQ